VTPRPVDVFVAELVKIGTAPGAWVALAAAVAFDAALGALARSGAVVSMGTTVSLGGDGTLAAVHPFVAIAVFAAGDEYRCGQLGVSLLAVPRRTRLFGAKLAATVVVAGVGAAVAVLPGCLQRPDGSAVPRVAAYVLLSLVGFGLAGVTRSVVTPLVLLVVVPVLVSPALGAVFPTLVEYFPYEAARSMLGEPRDVGTVVAAGWALVSVTAAWACVVRRDGAGR